MSYKDIVVKTSSLLAFALLSSQASAVEIKGVAHAGFEFGGDNVLHAVYTDGSKSDIRAGDGFVLAGGIATVINPEFSIQTTIGWKYQTIQQAENGDAYFTRFPLEALGQYTLKKVRFGLGPTYHLNPKLHASGLLAPAEVSFDNALGIVYQLDYVTEMGLILGVRYTDLEYTVKGTSYDVDADSVGIHVTGQF